MSTRWRGRSRGYRERVRRWFLLRTRDLPLKHRIDLAWLGLVAGGLLSLGFLWLGGVFIADSAGVYEPPPARPLEDGRLLVNIRDDLTDQPLLAAETHPADGRVYLAQTGGQIHRYHPATKLWSTERPFGREAGLGSDFTLLRSGCGIDPESGLERPCPDADSLWAMNAQGGLARRRSGNWKIALGDNPFLGMDGNPVAQGELTVAAVSPDKRWLAVGTTSNGVGIYHRDTRRWLDLEQREAFAEVGHLVWWQDRFWLGGSGGLARIAPGRDTTPIEVAGSTGNIIDMDAQPGDGLYILSREECGNGGYQCLQLARLADPEGEPDILLAARNHYSDLNLARLHYARQWRDSLTLAGEAGVYGYDLNTHGWMRYFEEPVSVAIPDRVGSGSYFGFAGGVGFLAAERRDSWPLPGERVAALEHGRGEVLALAESGKVFQLRTGKPAARVFPGEATLLDPTRFTSAVSIGDTVLFTGPQGALLHDIVTRTYRDIPKNPGTAWLFAEDVEWITSGKTLYLLSPTGDSVLPLSMRVAHVKSGHLGRPAVREPIPGPIRNPRAWADKGVLLIGGDGSVYHLTPRGRKALTGPALPALGQLKTYDVTQLDEIFWMSTNEGLLAYNMDSRTWGRRRAKEFDQYYAEIDHMGKALLARTNRNRLVRLDGKPTVLIGDERGFQIEDHQLSDVMGEGGRLILAGHGRVESYDLASRQITASWNIGFKGDVKLVGALAGDPVAISMGIAKIGDYYIDYGGGPVLDMFLDENRIWSLRATDGQVFLKTYTHDLQVADCYFRQAPPASLTRVYGIVTLPKGNLAVGTDVGLYFYRPNLRSWFAGPADLMAKGGELYHMGDHMLVLETFGMGKRLTVVPLNTVEWPPSCSQDPVSVGRITHQARHVTVDVQAGRAAWVALDGSVWEWSGGQTTELLGPESPAPDPQTFRRVFHREDRQDLLFTTQNDIRRYDLQARSWNPIALTVDNAAVTVADMNIETGSKATLVTVTTTNGAFYGGALPEDGQPVSLNLIHQPPPAHFDAAADDLLDVQARTEHTWTFVLKQGLAYFDPATRRWEAKVGLSDPDPTRRLADAAGRAVVTEERGRVWRVARDRTARPRQFARYDLNQGEKVALDGEGALWRLTTNGGLEKAELPVRGDYVDFRTHGPPLFLLNLQEVNQAFQLENGILFDTRSGLRLRGPGGETALHTAAASFNQVRQARRFGDRLWLLAKQALVLLGMEGEFLEERLYLGVSQVVFDHEDTPWAKFPHGWQRYQNGGFSTPQPEFREGEIPDRGLRFFAYEGLPVTGLDEGRFPYVWDRAPRRGPLPLPDEVNVKTVKGLIHGGKNRWWVLEDDRVLKITPAFCPSSGNQKEACLRVDRIFPLKGLRLDGLIGAQPAENSLVLFREQGEALKIYQNFLGWPRIKRDRKTLSRAGLIANVWPQISDRVVRLPDGRSAFDPVTDLIVDNRGQLAAVRPSGPRILARRGFLTPRQGPALDAGWLRWERDRGGFEVTTSQGRRFFSQHQFIRDRKLLFEEVNAVLLSGPGRVDAANRHGIWQFPNEDLRLNRGEVVYQPEQLIPPMVAAHGRFFARNGMFQPGKRGSQTAPNFHHVRLGDVAIAENLASRQLEFTVLITGRPAPAYDGRGFLWDRRRLAVAYDESGALWLANPEAIHSLEGFGNFDAGPVGAPVDWRELRTGPGSGIFLYHAGTWRRRSSGGWQVEAYDLGHAPWSGDLERWRTYLAANGFALHAAAGGEPRHFTRTWAGLSAFPIDRLRDAALHNGRLFLLTEASFQIADPADLSWFQVDSRPAVPGAALEKVSSAKGPQLLLREEKRLSRWHPGAERFVSMPSTEEPPRVLWERGRLRFTHANGRILKELQVENVSGRQTWVPFQFRNKRFPFDVVTSFAVKDEELFVGSAAGLQIYTGPLTAFDDIQAFYELRGGGAGALVPITKVGIPKNHPAVVMASSAGETIERPPGGPFIQATGYRDWPGRSRVQTSFWQWVEESDGSLAGHYQMDGASTRPVRYRGGRFSHDRLADVVAFGGSLFGLWGLGQVSLHPKGNLGIHQRVRNFPLDIGGKRFIPVFRDLRGDGTPVKRGLYLEGSGGKILLFDGVSWQPVRDAAMRAKLLSHAERPAIVDHARLRLQQPVKGQTFRFEHRDGGGRWHAVPWLPNGRLAIDDWGGILYWRNRILAATPAGIVSYLRRKDGQIVWDPDAAFVIRDLQELGAGPVTDWVYSQDTLYVRCQEKSDKLFIGRTQTLRDGPVFQPYDGPDPFAEQVMVDADQTGVWQWRLVDRRDGNPGSLVITLAGEEILLSGGRFTFDRLNSLSLHEDLLVDLAGTDGGWWRAPRDRFHVRHWHRPQIGNIDPSTITRIFQGWTGTAPALTLATRGGSFWRLAGGQTPERLARGMEHLGWDGFWRYWREGNSLKMIAENSRGGAGMRSLHEGRFLDDWALGPPVAFNGPEGMGYYLPTRAGVLRLDADFQPYAMDAPPFPGLPDGEVPRTLQILADGTPVYFDGANLRRLDNFRDTVAELKLDLPENALILALDHGAHQTLRLTWKFGAERGWNLLSLTDEGPRPRKQFFINLASNEVFNANRIHWRNPQPWMILTFGENLIRFTDAGQTREQILPLPNLGQLLNPILAGDRLLLMGSDDLLEIHLAPLIKLLFEPT